VQFRLDPFDGDEDALLARLWVLRLGGLVFGRAGRVGEAVGERERLFDPRRPLRRLNVADDLPQQVPVGRVRLANLRNGVEDDDHAVVFVAGCVDLLERFLLRLLQPVRLDIDGRHARGVVDQQDVVLAARGRPVKPRGEDAVDQRKDTQQL
jgi:hypothetical protein